jgi:hypothetical protein
MHRLRPRLLASAACGLGLAAALPAAAQASSVVYVQGGNVWSASPDGAVKTQLTDGGGWHSPTQADDGTLAAVQGTGPIVVMARDGRVLRTITTPPARSGDGGTFAPRPVDLSFSPDGSKIAYSYVAGSCPVASTCGTTQRSTFYTHTDVTEATPVATYGNEFSSSDPEWLTNDRVAVFGGSGRHVNLDDLTGPFRGEDGDYSAHGWFNDQQFLGGAVDLGDGEVSRDLKRIALVTGYGANTNITFGEVTGDPRTGPDAPADPQYVCGTDKPDPAFGDPSWSPDSQAMAFQSSEGVETIVFSKLTKADGCAITGPSKLLAAGATQPDWGPAAPPAARYVAPPPAPGPAAPSAPAGGQAPTGKVVLTGAARQRFKDVVTVGCAPVAAATCAAQASVRLGSRTLRTPKVTKRAAAGKRVALTLRFAARDAARLRAALRRGAKPKVTITVTAAGGTATKTVTLVGR